MKKFLYMDRLLDIHHDTLLRFLNKYFPSDVFCLQEDRSNSMTRWYTYNDDRSNYLKHVEEDTDGNFEGLRVKYFPVSPGSSVGRLIVSEAERRVKTVYLKPDVKISTNFNAMLTELLPIAWLRARTSVLLDTDGFLHGEVVDSIRWILRRQEKPASQIDNLINQLEEKAEYVSGKRREIELIKEFYVSHASSWSIGPAIESGDMYKWLGYDKTVKNYGYVDRADVQIGRNCRVSLKSVAPGGSNRRVFLCNTTFRAFMNDMQRFSDRRILTVGDDIVLRAAELFGAESYGELLEKYLRFLFQDDRNGLKFTHRVLHYILGDYRRDVRRNETGYNHIILTSSTRVRELGVDDSFISEALNRRPRRPADVVFDSGKMRITFGECLPRQMLDVQFTDSEIKPTDGSRSLKFKILENL